MNKYNPDIHHRRSIRLKGHDYSQAGLYFITICCQDRIYRFGHVENGKMILNDIGEIAYGEWVKTPKIRPNVKLSEFVIMPNHIHGIIRLSDRGESHSPYKNESHERKGVFKTPPRPPQSPSNNIGAIVRGYKSSVTRQFGLLGFNEKLWQRNYYEHIIRNEKSCYQISEYIQTNPVKWQDDKYYV